MTEHDAPVTSEGRILLRACNACGRTLDPGEPSCDLHPSAPVRRLLCHPSDLRDDGDSNAL